MSDQLTAVFGSYMPWKLNENTWIINFMGGSQNMYLLEGEDRALLIDTGWGAGNLRAFVERLTSKPIMVALTHGHLDHSGGCGEWEAAYMLSGAVGDLITLEGSPFDMNALPHPDFEKKIVKDGDTLDLGGRVIELIDISAHSNGSLAFLDRDGGLLFVGDEMESSQVLMFEVAAREDAPFVLDQRLRAHHNNMLRLKALQGAWKTILPAHNGAPIANSYLDDYIGLVEHIYAGDAVIEDKLNHPHIEADHPEGELCRVRWEKASFFVKKAELMSLYGKNNL